MVTAFLASLGSDKISVCRPLLARNGCHNNSFRKMERLRNTSVQQVFRFIFDVEFEENDMADAVVLNVQARTTHGTRRAPPAQGGAGSRRVYGHKEGTVPSRSPATS